MDCNNTKVFLMERARMCKAADSCSVCGLVDFCDQEDAADYPTYDENEIDEAIRIVQEWSDVNPPKTRLSVLKKHFPNYRRVEGHGEEPEICAEDLFGINCPYPIPDDGVCMKCWNTPIEEE